MKKFFLRVALCLVIVALLAYGIERFYSHITDGFYISRITSQIPFDPAWETKPLSPQERARIDSILDQKFIYLGKGSQCHVFTSEDQQYVIKFLKHQHLRLPWLLNQVLRLPFLDTYRQKKIQQKRERVKQLFASIKLAYEEAREETGTEYIQLNKTTGFQKQLLVVDNLGFERKIDLGTTEFIIQPKAKMLCPTITLLMQENQVEKVQQIFRQLLEVLIARSQKGIADLDEKMMINVGLTRISHRISSEGGQDVAPDSSTNAREHYPADKARAFGGEDGVTDCPDSPRGCEKSGLTQNRAIILDIGRLAKDDHIHRQEVYQKDIIMRFAPLKKWLEKEHPELIPSLEKELHNTLS